VHEWQVWFVAALLLFVAEMIAPGFWLLSVAVGALAAGLVALVLPGNWGSCRSASTREPARGG
jgi:membrane protein implicated in regulation of membrane protease activity